MKIIGTIGSENLLVEMSKGEFGRCAGFDYPSEVPDFRDRNTGSYGLQLVGMTVDVSAIYRRMRAQEKAADQLNQCAKTLRSLADLVEQQSPTALGLVKVPEVPKVEGGAA